MLRLLVVDDKPIRFDIGEWFRLERWDVELGADGKEGVTLLEASLQHNKLFDAVVLDRRMGLAGDEGDLTLKSIRARPEFDSVCIVMLTGYGEISNAVECLRGGAYQYLEKPLSQFADLRDILLAGILQKRSESLRRQVVFEALSAEATLTRVEKTIYETLLPEGENRQSDIFGLCLVRPDGSVRSLSDTNWNKPPGKQHRFAVRVFEDKRPVSAFELKTVSKAEPLHSGTCCLIAAPVPGDNGLVAAVLDVESAKPEGLKRPWVEPIAHFAESIGIAHELAEKRTQAARILLLAVNEFRHKLTNPTQVIEWKVKELQENELKKLRSSTSQAALAKRVASRLAAIDRSVATIRQLCYQLNDISAEIPVELAPLDLRSLVRECLDEIRSEARTKSIRIVGAGFPRRAVRVKADRRWIAYSMQCLLRNAIESIESRHSNHTAKKVDRQIVVRLEGALDNAGPVSISVRDTGVGIAERNHDRIFQPLFSTKKRRETGGLGLFSVQRILLQHGGSVSFESKAGHGATFTLTLPRD